MRQHYIIIVLVFLTGLGLAVPPVRADVDIEYIGHASFVIESPDGVRIVIDPFNSNRWLGFRYPESVHTDAAIAVLEAALGRAARGDWQYRMSARSLLAELYAAEGRTEEASEQYRIVAQRSYRTELLEKAKTFLEAP